MPNKNIPNNLFQLLTLICTCCIVVIFTSSCQLEQVSPVLWRGGEVDQKLAIRLKALGIKTIISTRLNPQLNRVAICKKLGMRYVQIPTGVFITPGKKEFDMFFDIVDNPKNQPCYICCQTDKDRTGLYCSVYAAKELNKQFNVCYQDMKRHHFFGFWFWKYKYVINDYVKEASLSHKASAACASSSEAEKASDQAQLSPAENQVEPDKASDQAQSSQVVNQVKPGKAS